VSHTRTTKKAVRTKGQILQEALRLFQAQGFERTTMRDVAKASGMSVGSTYYYFLTKEALIHEFYVESCHEFTERASASMASERKLEKRLSKVLHERMAQLKTYRTFLPSLVKAGIDPSSELSPFSASTKSIRDEAIAIFVEIVNGSDVRLPSRLKAHLPYLLWLYHLGIIMYWCFDSSANQQKSARLLDGSIKIISSGLKIAGLPLMGTLLKPILDLVDDLVGKSAAST
jgi:AcrR family transcriptional regulator